MALNIYDRDVHNFITTGARTACYPLRGQIDNGQAHASDPAISNVNGLWQGSTGAVQGPYYPRLLKIQCMSQTPTAGTVISILDNAGTAIYSFVFAADAADKTRDFWWGGLSLPKGGFGVTSTNGESWMYVFTYDTPTT